MNSKSKAKARQINRNRRYSRFYGFIVTVGDTFVFGPNPSFVLTVAGFTLDNYAKLEETVNGELKTIYVGVASLKWGVEKRMYERGTVQSPIETAMGERLAARASLLNEVGEKLRSARYSLEGDSRNESYGRMLLSNARYMLTSMQEGRYPSFNIPC